jgi:exosortase A-associated hydrolase 1
VHFVERALQFCCHDASLYGVLSLPEQPSLRGVLIVVGGPQYRAGSHRQFVLLARQLAEAGIPALRFDYRGMGDSEGDARSFEQVNDDIRAAVAQFVVEAPAVREIVIFGLCDAACAALFYAHRDSRICGLVLVNPWIRTSEGLAKAYLKHYYLARLLDRELWQKVFSGRFEYRKAANAFFRILATVSLDRFRKTSVALNTSSASCDRSKPLPDRMLDGFRRFRGRVLFILSGNDLTAKEFADMVGGNAEWRKRLASPAVDCRTLQNANHTFSRRDWRDQLGQWTKEWISSF